MVYGNCCRYSRQEYVYFPRSFNLFAKTREEVDKLLKVFAIAFANDSKLVKNGAAAEIMKVLGLRDGWFYLLNTMNEKLDLAFLEFLHSQIAIADVPYYELGKIRTENVLITGTVWRPELPDIEKLHKELTEIMSMECCVEKAVTLMLWIMRTQPFKDGNKRVATLAANKVLIEDGKGLLQIQGESILSFKKLLVEFYETNNSSKIKSFILDNYILPCEI